MNVILLSGGSGKRLWPLSNEARSKQFIKLFSDEHGIGRESMVQRVYRGIKGSCADANVVVATSENQVSVLKSQIGEEVQLAVEPCRRDTFPAIALATAYLHDKLGVDVNESVVVCPVDPYVDEDFYEALAQLSFLADQGESELTLMGIEPTYPSEKYGYIIPEQADEISRVAVFKEKPDADTASEYIKQGALWNAGIFAYRLGYVLGKAEALLGDSAYEVLRDRYETLQKISFDYAVVEHEPSIQVMRFRGRWDDIGTWSSFSDVMEEKQMGMAKVTECSDTNVVNELAIPVVALGLDNVIVAASPDGILVADKQKTESLKRVFEEETVEFSRPMYEERCWGYYKVYECSISEDGERSTTKELVILPGRHISYQLHHHRSEMWTITRGKGFLIIDGETVPVERGFSIEIKPETKHAVAAISELHIIEVQLGDILEEGDIERLDWDWSEFESEYKQ